MSTEPKAGPSVARARVPLVDKGKATPAKRFGLEGLVDLTATIGYYAMIACALNAFGIEPTPGEPLLEV